MLNFILAPLGLLLIGFGAVGLLWALKKSRVRTEPDVVEAPSDGQSGGSASSDDSRA